MHRVSIGVFSLVLLLGGLFFAGPMLQATSAAATPAAKAGPDCAAIYAKYNFKAGDACVAVIDASPDAPALDVYVDGAQTLANRPFASDSGVTALAAGKHRFQVVPAGKAPAAAVIDASVTVAAGRAYEIVVFDAFAKIQLKVFPVDLTPPAAKAARVRVIDVWRAAGTVDVALAGPGQAPTPADIKFKKVKFGRASTYVELPGSDQAVSLRLYAAGAGAPGQGAQLSACPAGEVCSVVLIGPGSAAPAPQYLLSEFFAAPPP